MLINQYISFFAITVTVTYSPGPMTMFLMNSGIQNGLRKTLPALLGASSAYFISILVYFCGVAHLLRNNPQFLVMIQYLGAAYMIYLGYKRIISAKVLTEPTGAIIKSSWIDLYKTGLFMGLLNPKAILLLSVVFPRFLIKSQNFILDCIILGVTFLVLQFSSGSCYCYFGQRIKHILLKKSNQRIINILIACIFFAIASMFIAIKIS